MDIAWTDMMSTEMIVTIDIQAISSKMFYGEIQPIMSFQANNLI